MRKLRCMLEELQTKDRTHATTKEESKIMGELDEWRLREELLWKQRSMVDWLKEGI